MGADAGPNGVLTDRWICTFFCPLKSKKYGLLKQMRVLDTGLGIYSVALVLELLVHSLTHSLFTHSFSKSSSCTSTPLLLETEVLTLHSLKHTLNQLRVSP